MPHPGFTASWSLMRPTGAYRSAVPHTQPRRSPRIVTPQGTVAEAAIEAEAPMRPVPVVPAQTVPTADCPTCAAGDTTADTADASYVYAIGALEPRFPSLGLEKEFVQATGRAETARLSDSAALRRVLAEKRNRYLLRRMCWVMSIQGQETYIVMPSTPEDYDMLLEALRPSKRPTYSDVVIGVRAGLAPPEMCNGLVVPLVSFSQIYSFEAEELIAAIPVPVGVQEEEFRPKAEELFYRIVQLADNAGATPEHRALNYLLTRYPAIYELVNDYQARDFSLTGVDAAPSRLSGVRQVVAVVFSFTNRNTDVTEKQFVRVDVTEEFPFLVTKLQPFFDH